MKKLFLAIFITITFFLASCTTNSLVYYDEAFSLDDETIFTELNFSETQFLFLESSQIETFIEFGFGYLVDYFSFEDSCFYVSYFAEDDVVWTIGGYSSIYDLSAINQDTFRMRFRYSDAEFRELQVGFFNIAGELVQTLYSYTEEVIETSNHEFIAIETQDYNDATFENYYVVMLDNALEKHIVMEFSNMRDVSITQISDNMFLIKTYNNRSVLSYYFVDELGQIKYQLTNLVLDIIVTSLEDGYFIDNRSDTLTKLNLDFEQIWQVHIEHNHSHIISVSTTSIQLRLYSEDIESFLEIDNEGTISFIPYITQVTMPHTYGRFHDGNRLVSFYEGDSYFGVIDSNGNLIWSSMAYDSISTVNIYDGIIYASVQTEEGLFLVEIEIFGEELSRTKIDSPIYSLTSDDGYITYENPAWNQRMVHATIYDSQQKLLWKTTNYAKQTTIYSVGDFCYSYKVDYTTDFFGSVIAANTGNILLFHYNFYDIEDSFLCGPGENNTVDIYSNNGDLLRNFKGIYSHMEYLLSTTDHIYFFALNSDNTEVLIQMDTEGNIVSEKEVAFSIENPYEGYTDYYFLQDSKLYQFHWGYLLYLD